MYGDSKPGGTVLLIQPPEADPRDPDSELSATGRRVHGQPVAAKPLIRSSIDILCEGC
jgi:hypothetical protein